MDVLQSLLAFALIMLAMATLASIVVEGIHRLLHLRQSGLERLLRQIYDDVIVGDDNESSQQQATEPQSDARERFLDTLKFKSGVKTAEGFWPRLLCFVTPNRQAQMSTRQFIERLADTEPGKQLAARLDSEVDLVISDIAQKYERYGADVSAYFRQRAAALSFAVGIVLALPLNIDAGRVFTTLVQQPELRNQVIEQLVVQLEETEDEPAAPAAAAPAAETKKSGAGGASEDIAAIKKEAAASGTSAATSQFARMALHDFFYWLGWLLSTLTAGVLIGIGAPFWFRTASSLLAIVQVGRSVGLGQQKERPTSAAPANAAGRDDGLPGKLQEVFKTAIKAKAILSTSGTPSGGERFRKKYYGWSDSRETP